MKKLISNKKAAVFGIEARIALVILSIVSMAIAVNRLAVNESERSKEATFRILKVADAIRESYERTPGDINFVEAIGPTDNFLWKGRGYLKTDPWGNNWVFKVYSDTLTVSGSDIDVKCVIIFSAGYDGYHYLANQLTAYDFTKCLNNDDLPDLATHTTISDDLFYKFTTADIDIAKVAERKAKLETIMDALMNYAQAKYNVELKYCNGLSISAANADPRCDIDNDGLYYTATELKTQNYYPKSSSDATVGVIYKNTTTYDDFGSSPLLLELGLPASYLLGPYGGMIKYNSNIDSSVNGPFEINLEYFLALI